MTLAFTKAGQLDSPLFAALMRAEDLRHKLGASEPDAVAIADNAEIGSAARLECTVVGRQHRVSCMRNFLLEHFTYEQLHSGPVLDVAGGKGDLSWILLNADGIDAVVVDPRCTNHRKLIKTMTHYMAHPDVATFHATCMKGKEQLLAKIALSAGASRGAPAFCAPRHLKVFLDAELLTAMVATNADGGQAWREHWARASERADAEGAV
eukprot:gnl/MRDRNA2_/MRDRNA2_52897_c0_seq1.p1 gnl/MRDRNA2_/MRDRNA2_52897_c0~~gnl/MRDRNA2_/MRDRNA2_52897_c0_seq1.p1  ORF type:complete len:209 (+),score=34.55 gnl/MRDRNA2_/MRDRNA2_52897_c0_seq1:395-1021(+)